MSILTLLWIDFSSSDKILYLKTAEKIEKKAIHLYYMRELMHNLHIPTVCKQ